MATKARFATLLVLAILAWPACQAALGYWSGSGATGNGAAVASGLDKGATPTDEATSSTTVVVSWAAGGLSDGVPADAYLIRRYDAETGTEATIGAACAGRVAAITCTESEVPAGEWEYTVTPLFGVNWRGPESARSAVVYTGPAYRTIELGEAGAFAVLGASTVTSAGVSELTGNLGVSPGTAMTGFRPPGSVSGTMDSADPASNKAQADLGFAYTDATERSPATLNSGSLGGQTLARGVYKATTFTINGEVTLDGRGDPGAVFIFQAGSTLTTGALSRVNLIDGAQACNVFWQVGSSATLGAASSFAGSILAYTSISMGAAVSMEGRALAHNAAVTLINDTVAVPRCASPEPESAVSPNTFSLSRLGTGPGGGSIEVTDPAVSGEPHSAGGEVAVDATPPPAPALGFTALTNAYWSGTGTAILYRPGASSGGFQVTASSPDPAAGTSAFVFPVLPSGWTGTAAGAATETYGWSAPEPPPTTGAQAVTATDDAGVEATSTFTLTPDPNPPSGGTVSYLDGDSSGPTVNVSFDDGTDSLSGIDPTSGILESATAPFVADTCGTFGAFAVIATDPVSGTSFPVTSGTCYEYRYSVADNVGNRTTYSSPDITEVGGASPPDPLDEEAGGNV
jgi:hypothetical protein